VKEARLSWGCGGCQQCDGSPYQYWWYYGPFTPSWQNSTTSYVYIYTNYGYTPLEPIPDVGAFVSASSTAKAYKWTYYIGTTSVIADWP
jgi:hypothetical protein